MDVTPAVLIGYGGNNILPAHMGELLRTFVFARSHGVSRGAVLATLVLERMFDVLAILAFYLLAMLLTSPIPASVRLGSALTALLIILLFAILALLLLFRVPISSWMERRLHWLPVNVRNRARGVFNSVSTGIASLGSAKLVLSTAAVSLLKWAAAGGMVWASLWAYGLEISFGVSMVVIAVSALAVTIPSTPGFFGPMQAAFVFSLTPFGIPQEAALAASILYLLAQWIPLTVLGLLFFTLESLDLGTVANEFRQTSQKD